MMTDYEAQMLHDFENRWALRHKLLNRVKDDLFPECTWRHLHPQAVEVINNIVESLAGK